MAKFLARSGLSSGNYFQTPGTGGSDGASVASTERCETIDRAMPPVVRVPSPVPPPSEEELEAAATPAARRALVRSRALASLALPKFIVPKVRRGLTTIATPARAGSPHMLSSTPLTPPPSPF